MLSLLKIYLDWMKYLSWFRYCNEVFIINQWRGVDDIEVNVNNIHNNPKQILYLRPARFWVMEQKCVGMLLESLSL